MDKNTGQKRTELAELGEFALIDHLTKSFKIHHPGTLKGIGDDAAVLMPTPGMATVVTTDLLVEGIHFDLMYCPLNHLGYKSIIANLSDIYAMNATPRQVTVSIAISNRFSVEALDELYYGMRVACEKYNVDLIGGDTTTTLKGFTISVTAIGEALPEKITYRHGARKNDLVCVSGDLGAAYIGLQLLERERRIYLENPTVQPDLGENTYTVGRQLKPEARKDIVELLEDMQIVPTSMIDISDGLSSELHHICKQSQCGCAIYEDKIPMHDDMRRLAYDFNIPPTTCALSGGEDYELLFTVDLAAYDALKNNMFVTIIGHITDASEGLNLVTPSGAHHPLIAQGWKAV
jgi:thiamine-monophosphate kinase